MSNRYKKYFDNISPDEKLVEETKQKMLDELDKKNNVFNIKPYAAVAACLAFAVSAVVLAPSLAGSPVINDTPHENNNAAEYVTGSTAASVFETSSFYEEITSSDVLTALLQVDTEETHITTLEYPAVSDTSPQKTETVSKTVSKALESAVQTENNASVTEITVPSHADETHSQTSPSLEETMPPAEIPPENTVSVPNTSDSFSGGITLRPGVHVTQFTTAECTTAQASEPQFTTAPPCTEEVTTASSNNISSDFVREISAGDKTIFLNLGFEYEYNFPAYASKVRPEDAKEHFGEKFIPSPLDDLFPQETGYANRYDRDYAEGICYVFGEETYIDKVSGRFVSMTVCGSETSYGYDISYISPVSTFIDGEEYVFGTMGIYENVYFCRFVHDGIHYKFLFKGYSAEEMMDIILSL